jgi:hypothetical protein
LVRGFPEFARQEKRLRRQVISGRFTFRPEAKYSRLVDQRYKTTLFLPKNLNHVFESFEFKGLIESIRREPSTTHSIVLKNIHAEIAISWNPGLAQFRFYRYPAYNLASDFEHNVVYNALEHKSGQIKRAGTRAYSELAGVFLCDGSCGMLRAGGNFQALSVDQVINEFLRRSGTVDFVCVVDVRERGGPGSFVDRSFEAQAWSARYQTTAATIENQLNKALSTLPRPVRSPQNTLNQFALPPESSRRHIWDVVGGTMTAKTMEISLRATMEYLAGCIDRRQYEQLASRCLLESLRQRLTSGIGIEEVTIGRESDRDDDRLVIRFGDADPARAPFTVPNSTPQS